MSALEGPDLALAVAKVMEKIAYIWAGECWEGLQPLPGCIVPLDAKNWRPDLGGAAGAQALDWLCQHHRVSIGLRDGEFACHRWPIRCGNLEMTTGPTKWIALCRAIAAYEQACSHQWVNPTNEAVDANGHKVCVLCGAIQ